MLFVGDDWAEAHHDVEIQDETGRRLLRRKLPEGIAGIGQLHALLAEHLGVDAAPEQVVVGIETDRGPWVQALLAAGYQVYAINPLSAARYRERHVTSGAKSDPGDAKVLADLVRTDRQHHRPIAGDSELAEAIKVVARAHQSLIWTRQRQTNALRSTLREFYPAALLAFEDLAGRDALAVLAKAPTPEQGKALRGTQIEAVLRAAGRQRNLRPTAEAISAALRTEQLTALPQVGAGSGRAWPRTSRSPPSWSARSPASRRAWRRLLSSTRAQRSCAVCPDSVWSSALGCWRSSGTTRTATPMLEPARTTPGPLRSPARRGRAASCLPATPATGASPTPSTCGRSARSTAHQA